MLAVAHVVEDFSPTNSGVTAAVCELAGLMRHHGVGSSVLAAGDNAVAAVQGTRVVSAPVARLGRGWRRAPALREGLLEAIRTGAIPHIHGLWMYPQWMAATECARQAHRFVLTPHNMLGGWLWRRGTIRQAKKAAYWKMFAYPAFRHAAVVHALTAFERDVLRDGFFESQRIEVIPHSVDVHEAERRAQGRAVETGRSYFLFLGRLHPVKGLELLIDAHSRLSDAPELWIGGATTDPSYERALRERAARSDRSGAIRFLGEVDGDEKWGLLKGAWSLCAPSYSEGLSMSALEALACGTPVITTPEAGLPDTERGGGILAEPTTEAIEEALRRASNWSVEDRKRRGAQARAVALDTYAPAVVGPKYVSMYQSLAD
jgi:glycosyltransferase involved in cell wall biosynthesis